MTIFVVWIQYPNEPKRYSAAFTNLAAANDYAKVEPKAFVTQEAVYETADEAR